jgi:hypothetical protein
MVKWMLRAGKTLLLAGMVAAVAETSNAKSVLGNEIHRDAPPGYSVVIATEGGKRLAAHKSEAKSLSAALSSGLEDLARWFDAKPVAKGAFADSKEQRRGGALFSATLKGQPVKGLIYCVNSLQGADITVTYCRADASAIEWSKLSDGTNAPGAAASSGVPMREYAFPDGTGSI